MEDQIEQTEMNAEQDPLQQDQRRPVPDEDEKKLVSKLCARIKADKAHHKTAFDEMRRDQKIARRGAPDSWPKNHYVANITGRHIRRKTAALYAKNPKAVARRSEKLDFQVWDESEQTLMQALQVMQAASAGDPVLLMQAGVSPAQVQQSMVLLQDYQAGMLRRQQIEQIGKTLEICFHYFTNEQTPLSFKSSMKQLVRRACTSKVGYVKLGFQREYGNNPDVTARIADFRGRLDKIVQMSDDIERGDQEAEDLGAMQRELELSLKSLEEQEYVLIREGLTFDFLRSTAVVPDRLCTELEGFGGARWVTVEHLHTVPEVERKYKVQLGTDHVRYGSDGTAYNDQEPELDFGDETMKASAPEEMVCVWEHYDKETGVVYLICDGYPGFLRDPGAPDVYVEDFWPIYGLTFNEVEDDKNLFPPSDVELMSDMQNEYNRSRQGKREHRRAARPRFMSRKGALDDESKIALQNAEPFSVTEVNPLDGNDDLTRIVQPLAIPGVDPNLYDTGEIFTDIQLTVGASEAQFGMASGATATESSIAQSSFDASTDSDIDDLDNFLTRLARGAGQIMLRELSQETVMEIAGPGAVWPQMTLEEIAKELVLEIEAGSSGKPNQVQEIRNWQQMLPYLLQMPNISPTWLARESLNRLDDRLDLTEAITENIPSITAMNGMQQAMPTDPAADPNAQGSEGANNNPAPPGGPSGTDAPMGNNQQQIV